jgi:hypothetical protein
MMNQTIDDERPSLSMCCASTIALVQRQRRDLTCLVCGEHYFYDAASDPDAGRDALLPAAPTVHIEAPSRPCGAAPDARVQVADEARLSPSTVPPGARITHVEDAELVRVRRLLTELRPDKGGPLGWAPDGAPPAAGGSNWTPTLRVQTSVEVPAILPGAFASQARESAAPRLDPATTLGWLQRFGTLSAGLRALYADCAEAMAPTEVRAKWKALAPRDVLGAAVVYGRKRVLAAMAEWWREDALPEREISPLALEAYGAMQGAARASAETGEALARVRGRVSVVAEGHEG